MLHLTLRQLEIFCAVAQAGSTVAAADAVALSQSATSAALQQLEQAMGAQLFERVGRRLALNDAGRALLPEALALLEQADRKSTRLNSSHGYISYAVFCLKQKTRH